MRVVVSITFLLVALLSAAVAIPSRAGPLPPGRPLQSATKRLRIGLVYDIGGRGDKSFNDAAYAGVERATRELPVDAEYIEPGDGADRESGIRLLAAKGFDLIIGVGFIFSDDLYQIAREYPERRFACIDYAKFDEHGFVAPPSNLVALKFREEEGSFLVGALAALESHTQVVGFVGGMEIPLIKKFAAGYQQGVAAVCPACRVLVAYAGVTGEAFKNPAKGKELALAEYAAGADILFQAAGSTGLGVFEAARERQKYAIGVDADQWNEAPGRILTSMTKEVDVSVYATIVSLLHGQLQGGVHVFGLKERGVDYVFDDHNRGLIAPSTRLQVEALRQDILDGKRHVEVPQ